MKKYIISLILTLLILNIMVADVSAKTVFLTSDNIIDSETDKNLLKSIKDYVEELSKGKLEVEIDPKAPGPGEGTRAISSNSDVRVVISASCAGNLYILAKYAVTSENQVIYINAGDFDLDNQSNLRRAWDDNYSNATFAGLNNPGKFLDEAGINYIQPVKQFSEELPDGVLNSDNDDVAKYIAQEIIKDINSYDNSSKSLDTKLLVTHKLPVNQMAKGSSKLYAEGGVENESDTYNGYTAPQLLYLTSSYLNGNSLEKPANYENPSSPMKASLFTEDSYTIYEYIEMAGIVKNYMDENQKAPDYIEYNGAYISYYDLQYNFAKITKNHTNYKHMDFEKSYEFDKVNESILLSIIPILIIGIVILSGYLFMRKRKVRKRKRFKK